VTADVAYAVPVTPAGLVNTVESDTLGIVPVDLWIGDVNVSVPLPVELEAVPPLAVTVWAALEEVVRPDVPTLYPVEV
jgi:hypothetical protein